MMTWEVLITIGVALMIGEIWLGGFVLLPIGIAFAVTGLLAPYIPHTGFLLAMLATLQLVAFLAFRSWFRRRPGNTALKTNAEGMIGQEAIVDEPVSLESGYVKLYGDRWPARTRNSSPLPKGTRVRIEQLDGNKVFVQPIEGK